MNKHLLSLIKVRLIHYLRVQIEQNNKKRKMHTIFLRSKMVIFHFQTVTVGFWAFELIDMSRPTSPHPHSVKYYLAAGSQVLDCTLNYITGFLTFQLAEAVFWDYSASIITWAKLHFHMYVHTHHIGFIPNNFSSNTC